MTLLLLLCSVLLLSRMMGLHLHLCLDGSEPPAALHFEDVGHHAAHHDDVQHQDVDLSLAFEAVAKAVKQAGDLPALLIVVLLLPLLRSDPGRRRWRHAAVAVCSPPQFLRPPLRGPPLIRAL